MYVCMYICMYVRMYVYVCSLYVTNKHVFIHTIKFVIFSFFYYNSSCNECCLCDGMITGKSVFTSYLNTTLALNFQTTEKNIVYFSAVES